MSDKMVQFTALLFREKTKKLEQQIAAADTEIKKPYPTEERKKRVSSPMINCANSVSSHKPFQKGQKSKSNYKYYQKNTTRHQISVEKKKKKKKLK